MHFDLRGRGRRRTVQVIYVTLAILLGGGLVLFGIGGATSGGLLDALQGNGGGGSASSQIDKSVKAAEKRTKANPSDAAAWAALARTRYQAAGVGDEPGQEALAEQVIGGGGEEIVVPEPGGYTGADDVRAVRDRVRGRAGNPFRHQGAGTQPGSIGAQSTQVAQPGEAMGAGPQHSGTTDLLPPTLPQRSGSCPATSMPVTSVLANTLAPRSCAYSRISVPARSGSTTETSGV